MTLFIIILSVFFLLGYGAIIFEKFLTINKSATALLMAVGCWIIYFFYNPLGHETELHLLNEQLADIAQIIFFLMAAMAIVELIDSHHGFKIITDLLYASTKRKMMWLILFISFFMSSVLDNLTTMIVMTSLLKKLIPDKKERWFMGSLVVISVNAGGAWTPIGDVTTTMLWINHRITTWETIKSLFIPSVVCAAVAGLLALFFIKGPSAPLLESVKGKKMEPGAKRVLIGGILALVLIPVWKALLGLPPFLGALIGLGVLWLVTDLIHYRYGDTRWHLRVPSVLGRIDASGILFFLGILLAVSSLAVTGILKDLALGLDRVLPNQNYLAFLIGVISSIVDNVPLVAATFGMYDLNQFPVNSTLWQLIAYAAGTGGSIFIIGSAAGVAFMGLEGIDFIWYFKRIAWIATIGYCAGFFIYFVTAPYFS